VKDYLYKYCKGYDFRQNDVDEWRFDIRLPPSTAAQLDEFIQRKKLYGQTRLATGDTIECLFTNKVQGQKKRLESISQFHPLIRFISADLQARNEAFYPLVAIQITSRDLNRLKAGIYAFFVNRWSFSGLKTDKELPVRAIHMQSNTLLLFVIIVSSRGNDELKLSLRQSGYLVHMVLTGYRDRY